MAEFPALPLFVDDYEAATAHLTLEEDGTYMRLLRLCWRQSDCSIPTDDDWIMRRMRCDQVTYARVVKPILAEFFTRSRGRWFQKRLRGEHAYVRARSDARAEAGRRGGIAKSAKSKAMKPSKATILPEQNDGKAVAPTPTPNPEEEGAVAVRERAPASRPSLAAEGTDLGELLSRVMAAVGLNPNDIPSAHWMPNVAEQHILGWLNADIPPDAIVRVAGESRQRHRAPPNGPKALDGAMRAWITARSTPAFTAPSIPIETGSDDARRPSRQSRGDAALSAFLRGA